MNFLKYLLEKLSPQQEDSFEIVARNLLLNLKRKTWFSKVGEDIEAEDTLKDISDNTFSIKMGYKQIDAPKKFNMYLEIYKNDNLIFAKEHINNLEELKDILKGLYEFGDQYIGIKNFTPTQKEIA